MSLSRYVSPLSPLIQRRSDQRQSNERLKPFATKGLAPHCEAMERLMSNKSQEVHMPEPMRAMHAAHHQPSPRIRSRGSTSSSHHGAVTLTTTSVRCVLPPYYSRLIRRAQICLLHPHSMPPARANLLLLLLLLLPPPQK